MKKRAFSLLELVVAVGVLLVVAALGGLLFKRSLQAATRGSLRVEMEQQALVAMHSLLSDLRQSCPAGVSIRSGVAPKAIAVCPLSLPERRPGSSAPVQLDGTLIWNSFFYIYHYDEAVGCLRKREWPPGSVSATAEEISPAFPRRLAPERLAQVVAGSGTRDKILCRGVTGFFVDYPTGGSDSALLQPLRIRLDQERRGFTGRPEPERFSYVRSVFIPEQR